MTRLLPLVLLFLQFVQGNGNNRSEISEPQCGALLNATKCSQTKGWCEWGNSSSECIGIYPKGLFIGTFSIYPVAIPIVYTLSLSILWEICVAIVNRCRLFQRIATINRQKCCAYIYQFILTSYVFIRLAIANAFQLLWQPSLIYTNSLNQTSRIISAFIAFACAIPIGYAIELSGSPQMRPSLKLHHYVTILFVLIGMAAVFERIDASILRMGLASALAVTTEQSVFLQLLIYRLFPQWSPVFQWIGLFCYAATRVLVIVAMLTVFIQWCDKDFIDSLFSGHTNGYPMYTTVFVVTPLIVIVFAVVWTMSLLALLHMAKSSQIASVERRKLMNPRIRELRTIFDKYVADEFENSDDISAEITFDGWTEFIRDFNVDASIGVCTLLFECVGCDVESGKNMKWRTFRKIFNYSLKNVSDKPVPKVVTAKLRLLFKKMEQIRDDADGSDEVWTEADRADIEEIVKKKENIASLVHLCSVPSAIAPSPMCKPLNTEMPLLSTIAVATMSAVSSDVTEEEFCTDQKSGIVAGDINGLHSNEPQSRNEANEPWKSLALKSIY